MRRNTFWGANPQHFESTLGQISSYYMGMIKLMGYLAKVITWLQE